MKLTSPAFEHEGKIPPIFTCDGEDISPQLNWKEVPDGANSLTLIMEDPDAPAGSWVHWVIYNIPLSPTSLPENCPKNEKLVDGSIQGKNSWGDVGYGGPCPPGGTHRYFFKLFALDEMLRLEPGAAKQDLLDAMKGHVIAEAELMGKYKRQR